MSQTEAQRRAGLLRALRTKLDALVDDLDSALSTLLDLSEAIGVDLDAK